MSSHDSSTNPGDPSKLQGYLPPGYWPPPTPKEVPGSGDSVDQVAIRKLGGFNFMTAAQWNALDRSEQLRLIQDGRATFLFQGEEVPLKEALLRLKALRDAAE